MDTISILMVRLVKCQYIIHCYCYGEAFTKHYKYSTESMVGHEKIRSIMCGQCTCMAGLGEACSHITALFFTLEGNTLYKRNTLCTLLPCSWLPPPLQNARYVEIADIDFRTPAKKRYSVHHHAPDDHAAGTISSSHHQGNQQAISGLFQEPSEADIMGFYSPLAKDDSNKPAVLSLIQEHCEG